MPASINTKRRLALARWIALLRQHFPAFSRPQAIGLALWSIGIVLAASASLHAVALALASWLPFRLFSIRRRLQEWYLEAGAKKGHGSTAKGYQRRDWDPHLTAPALLRWILDGWPNRQLVLVLDPTNFGDRFTVLNMSVLYRGCAVPVSWTVLQGGQPGAWEPHWERMLAALAQQVPAGWQVLVLTDRGMYSPHLFGCVRQLHWHPFLRIRAQGFYRPLGSHKWLNLEDLHPPMGQTQAFPAELFKNEEGRLQGTLVAYQGAAYAEPWLLVTDLSAEIAQASWYGLRGWVEQGYKRVKSEGWQLQRTRIRDCARLERLWLAMAVATMWVLEVGGAAEIEERPGRPRAAGKGKQVGEDTPTLPDLEAAAAPQGQPAIAQEETAEAQPQRIWSVFSRGWNLLRNALAVGLLLLAGWHPEPWPGHPMAGLPPTPQACACNAEGAGGYQPKGSCSTIGSHDDDSS
jgi:Transposase DDE domain